MNNPDLERLIATHKILEILLALPPTIREDVIDAIQYNDFFCWHCGTGDRENPNLNCKCWNDE